MNEAGIKEKIPSQMSGIISTKNTMKMMLTINSTAFVQLRFQKIIINLYNAEFLLFKGLKIAILN
jgi:hypothetical protein